MLHLPGPPPAPEAFAERLVAELPTTVEGHPAARVVAMLAKGCRKEEVRDFAPLGRFAATAAPSDRRQLEWIAALSCEPLIDEDSPLQTVRCDYLIGNMRSILGRTAEGHLVRCLFRTWDYADSLDNQSLHWEPTEDRRHAYQWHTPSGDPTRKRRGGMLGANRLALEAWPLFPCVGRKGRISTRGFLGAGMFDTFWTWPLWTPRWTSDTVAGALALPDLQPDAVDVGGGPRQRDRGGVPEPADPGGEDPEPHAGRGHRIGGVAGRQKPASVGIVKSPAGLPTPQLFDNPPHESVFGHPRRSRSRKPGSATVCARPTPQPIPALQRGRSTARNPHGNPLRFQGLGRGRFPRPHGRGRIEGAIYVLQAVVPLGGFHDPTVVAELKAPRVGRRPLHPVRFHDPTVVAELKDACGDVLFPPVQGFHDPTVVAELKGVHDGHAAAVRGTFPRPHGRGRIEGLFPVHFTHGTGGFHDPTVVAELKVLLSALQRVQATAFPRPHGRGRIEGVRHFAGARASPRRFHDPTVVAELKVFRVVHCTNRSDEFPRPHGRGRIEGCCVSTVATGIPGAARFPRPHGRGRIEGSPSSELRTATGGVSTTPRSWPN